MFYEHHSRRPISGRAFALRMARHAALALFVSVLSLGVGMAGYAYCEGLAWLDAFLNAAMLLGGMGPIHQPATAAGKLFAGIYALYAGLVFLLVAAVMLAPVLHRILHHFHWMEKTK
jgi:hypothetical protein